MTPEYKFCDDGKVILKNSEVLSQRYRDTAPPAQPAQPAYDKVLQALQEMRPAAVAVNDKPGSWWLDRFEEAVKQLKEENT
jgi:hypothetical protein